MTGLGHNNIIFPTGPLLVVSPEHAGTLARDGIGKAEIARAVFERAGQAVMAKIMANDKAAAALQQTGIGRVAIPAVNAPDLQKAAAKQKV